MTTRQAFDAAVKEHGVRGLARLADVSPTFVSLVKQGKQAVPTSGKLAVFLGISERTVVTVKPCRA